MPKKREQNKKRTKLTGDERIIDLLERIGVVSLYLNTNLNQNNIAKKLSMDIRRVNPILKGLKKPFKVQHAKKTK